MADRTATLTWVAKDAASGPVKNIRGAVDDLGGTAQRSGGLMDKLGAATGGFINPATLAAGAGAALTGVLINAAQAAMEDEESVKRLTASLKANAPAWDGNLSAVERNISAAQRLAFEDEELRDSLALLVGATNDVADAEKIMATAMDLARFKGIDLRTASEALIKVESGQYRALKQLGIVLKEGATSTEALAAVQKVAGGQAEAYGETTKGSMEAAQIAIGELVEEIGSGLLPILGAIATVARSDVIPAVRELGGDLDRLMVNTQKETDVLGGFADSLVTWATYGADFMTPWDGSLTISETETKRKTEAMVGYFNVMRDATKDDLYIAGEAMTGLGTKAADAATKTELSTEQITAGVRKMTAAMVSEAKLIISDYYGPIETAQELAVNKREIAEQQQIVASKNSTKEQVQDAKLRVTELQHAQLNLIAELGGFGTLTSGQLTTAIKTLQADWATASVDQRAQIDATIRKLVLLRLAALEASGALNSASAKGPGFLYDKPRADGGPVAKGGTYLVGERGPELFSPQTSGTITPNGGGGPVTFNVTMNGVQDMDGLMQNLQREVNRQGMALVPRGT